MLHVVGGRKLGMRSGREPHRDDGPAAVAVAEGHAVVPSADDRSPVAVRAVTFAAPAEVTGSGSTATVPVKIGYTGTLTASVAGPVHVDVTVRVTPRGNDRPGGRFSFRIGRGALAQGWLG
jgi:hypothetical protein